MMRTLTVLCSVFCLIGSIQATEVTLLSDSSTGDWTGNRGNILRTEATLGVGSETLTLANYYFSGLLNFDLARNFHVFDLSGIAPGSILSAEMKVIHSAVSTDGQNNGPQQGVNLYDVTGTDPRTADATTQNAVHTDLGDGTVYGSFIAFAPGSNGTTETIALNADGVAALNAAAGSEWIVGMALFPASAATNGGAGAANQLIYVFQEDPAGVSSVGASSLVLQLESAAIPEPTSGLFLASLAMGAGAAVRRRRK